MPTISKMTIFVNEASIKNNNMGGNYSLNPDLNGAIKRIDDNNYALTMSVQIVNTEEKPFPIDLKAKVTGTFEFINESKEEIIKFMRREAIQLVYPYLRSVATSLTAIAFVNPIVLPLIDAAKITENIYEC